ncbi:sensor histidine kinase [Capsulimonas corticalis]|uniref:Sensor histidine kinase n=1 Tax=Capsulimonas corticalis TaxID=2219043 RepID=A0A402CZX2_9BACT|nr:histidine kinase [Capsulimonas corticalis]BDI33863.1 sensor histidine kinase [Capsulimonas corticalis]
MLESSVRHVLTLLNAFIEDTSVIVMVAYLLTRSPAALELLEQRRRTPFETVRLGVIFGIAALTEIVFPGARYPYVTDTLIITFVALTVGIRVALVCVAFVVLGALSLEEPVVAAESIFAAFACVLVTYPLRMLTQQRFVWTGLLAGVLTQAWTLAFSMLLDPLRGVLSSGHAAISVAANGFGVLLLMLVTGDARTRARSERHRLQAERAEALSVRSRLAALQARLRPHFLFNTLTAIAALCRVAPEQAEEAVMDLSALMRQNLRGDENALVPIHQDLETARVYARIAEKRFGERLTIHWRLAADDGAALMVPAFTVQTLLENAIVHGVEPKMEPGTVVVSLRGGRGRAILAVQDDGAGMARDARRTALEGSGPAQHGLQILTRQMRLLYGERSRVRLYSNEDAGTLAVLMVPDGRNGGAKR